MEEFVQRGKFMGMKGNKILIAKKRRPLFADTDFRRFIVFQQMENNKEISGVFFYFGELPEA